VQPAQKNDVEILALEAEIDRYTKLLDKSFDDKEPFEKIKLIFHDLKILTDQLAEMKTVKQHKKGRRVLSYLRVKISRA